MYRIMAKGEDGMEWCIANNIPSEDDAFSRMAKERENYPESKLSVESERVLPSHYYDDDRDLY